MKLTDAEKAVIDKVLVEVVNLRDASVRLSAAMVEHGVDTAAMEGQWRRYANAETVLVEIRDRDWSEVDEII